MVTGGQTMVPDELPTESVTTRLVFFVPVVANELIQLELVPMQEPEKAYVYGPPLPPVTDIADQVTGRPTYVDVGEAVQVAVTGGASF